MTTPTKDIIIPESWIEKYDLTVKECAEALIVGGNTIKDSLVVMNGIKSLKAFFRLPQMKELIEMSRDNRAGFLTDRNPKALRKHNDDPNKKYELKPYSYEQIIEALLPCILDGYRPHGNEINIISGNGMPVKKGKYRKIIDMTDGFRESISTPAIKDNHAFIKCRAKWKIEEQIQTIGYDENDEVHIKIPFGKWDSLDKVRGLAQSKLYTQVLARITGRFIDDEPQSIDITDKAYEVKPETQAPPTPKPIKKAEKQQPAPPKKAAPEGIIPEIAELQDVVGSEEYSSVIGRLITEGTLHENQIEEVLKTKDPLKAQAIIDLLEQSK